MSRFIDTLTALMSVEEITQATLAERSGLVQSTISRFLKNEREPSAAQVGQLCAGISSDRARRLELLLAWVRDQVSLAGPVAGIDERHFILAPSGDEPHDELHGVGTLAAELELIGHEASQHDDMRAVVVDLAALIRRHRAEVADAALAPYPLPHDVTAQVAESGSSPPPSHNQGREEAEEHRRAQRELSKVLKARTPPAPKRSAPSSTGEPAHG